MKRLFFLMLFLIVPASSPAYAHVLITDQTGTNGAILHIVPDDDPVAGQEATLFLDVQSEPVDSPNAQVKLTVKDEEGRESTVDPQVNGSLITARYTFPAQGMYELTYVIDTSDNSYSFQDTRRVTRGVAPGKMDQSNHAWAEASLVAGSLGLATLFIVAFNRRRDIAAQSKL